MGADNKCYDEARLSAFVDGELSAPELAEIEEHVLECPACGAAVARMINVGRKMRTELPDISANAKNRMRLAVESGIEKARFRRLEWVAAGLVGVAACLAIMGAVYTWTPEAKPVRGGEVATVEDAVIGDDVVASAGNGREPVGDWMVAELSGGRSRGRGQ